MRLSIWLTTWLLNTGFLALFVSSLWQPFGLDIGVQAFIVVIVYAVIYGFYLRCPICRTLTSGWWLGGSGFFAFYFSAPLMNPGRCGRCHLGFHKHAFSDDLRERRRRWRLDNA